MDVPVIVLWIVGVLSAASLAVWTKIFVRTQNGEPLLAPFPGPVPQIHWMPLLLTVLIVAQSLLGLLVARGDAVALEIERVQTSVVVTIIVLALLLYPLIPDQLSAVSLGFTGHRWRLQVAVGFTGFIASVLPVVICMLATFWMREDSANEHAYLQAIKAEGSFELLFWVCLSAVVVAPIFEELIYRVVLQTWLEHIVPPRQALIIVAAIFATIHRLPDAIPLFPLALVLGYLYQRQRSFLTIVTVHALFNAVNIAIVLMSSE